MSWTHHAWEAVAELIGRRTGLTFANRCDSAELGMRRAMARAKLTDPAPYLDLVAMDEQAFDDLVSELTVGETYFFREPRHFEVIRRDVVPDIRRRRGPGHTMRAWSAACASGEEAYSLAILFAQEPLGESVRLLATDISCQALAKARRAVYSAWSLRGEQGKAALPYLIPAGNHYRLDESIRRRVTFESLNLALDVYPSFATSIWGMDLILCRNVLIYFDRDTIRKVARRLYQTLADGGWLLTASSDPPLWEDAPFTVESRAEGVFYRRLAPSQNQPHENKLFLPSGPNVADVTLEPTLLGFEESAGAELDTAASFLLSPTGTVPGKQNTSTATTDCLDEARQALARGDYARVLELTGGDSQDPSLTGLHVRALANVNLPEAEKACVLATTRFSFAPELHYLHAVLLLDLGRPDDAVRAMRRVLYLDRSLAIAHFTLGSLLRRRGDVVGARRAYRNARDLCACRPADDILPLADGEPAGRLAQAAARELTLLESQGGEA